eukprot:GHVP01048743.1.p1 GENE.GHVP01048743.1~~GHVP01048743.1.p1  ORF type:complete len:419 (+),score=64.90 GHVP01048743.1:610-1866(+)
MRQPHFKTETSKYGTQQGESQPSIQSNWDTICWGLIAFVGVVIPAEKSKIKIVKLQNERNDFDNIPTVTWMSGGYSISSIKFSPQPSYICGIIPSRSRCQIWNLEDPSWNCVIDEPNEVLTPVEAIWPPNNSNLILLLSSASPPHQRFSECLRVWDIADEGRCLQEIWMPWIRRIEPSNSVFAFLVHEKTLFKKGAPNNTIDGMRFKFFSLNSKASLPMKEIDAMQLPHTNFYNLSWSVPHLHEGSKIRVVVGPPVSPQSLIDDTPFAIMEINPGQKTSLKLFEIRTGLVENPVLEISPCGRFIAFSPCFYILTVSKTGPREVFWDIDFLAPATTQLSQSVQRGLPTNSDYLGIYKSMEDGSIQTLANLAFRVPNEVFNFINCRPWRIDEQCHRKINWTTDGRYLGIFISRIGDSKTV